MTPMRAVTATIRARAARIALLAGGFLWAPSRGSERRSPGPARCRAVAADASAIVEHRRFQFRVFLLDAVPATRHPPQ